MGRIIPFDFKNKTSPVPQESEEPEEYIWTCAYCESNVLYCLTDGRIECSECGEDIHDRSS